MSRLGEITAKQFETLSLQNIAGQDALEGTFREALEEVMANIFDERTEATASRSIKITLTFKPGRSRDKITLIPKVTKTIADIKLDEDILTVSRGRSGKDKKVFRERGEQVELAEADTVNIADRRNA